MRLAVGSLLAVAFGIGFASLSSAQAPDIRIAELKCNGDPELVTIENAGDAAQSLAGWRLESDPAGEVFDLSALGGLQPGASIIIQAGPSATGVFRWGTQFVFRDDDPTDYVRIVDNNGATVDQVNCSGATPAAPSPTVSPPNGVPNGGGAPPLPDGPLTPLTLMAVGMALAVAGAAAIAFLGLRARPVAVAAAAAPSPARTAPAVPAVRGDRRVGPVRRPSGASGPAVKAVIGFAALGLLVALAFLLFRGRD
ncbi:MAG: lamin tail domain-containing protein [Dehalococcoidia bacterium]|nr:lamin tail domain-containing protein [Dehalococcoidia bacterium]